ncbi:MAG TPA: homoserine kinase [Chthoniobacterales bacterium]
MKASIRVPGTSANLGPGFDCLGVALSIYNVVSVEKTESPVELDSMPTEVGIAFFAKSKIRPFPFTWKIAGDVPRSRGLGSSVTVRLGLLHGLNEISGKPLSENDLFLLCAALEGHPDNAAPAAFGGFTVARPNGAVNRFEIDDTLQFVLLIPDFEVRTADARKVMPAQLTLADAVTAIGNAAAITAAFAAKDYTALQGTFHDTTHQPYREPLIPFLSQVISAAEDAGALGGFLSGSGSTIAAVTLHNAQAIAAAMANAAGLDISCTRLLTADNRGVQNVENAPT